MHSFLDAKAMAKALRSALAARDISLSHAESLELVARQFGLADWNTLAARIAAARAEEPALALPDGWRASSHTDPACYRLGLDPEAPGTVLIESRYGRGSGIDLSGDSYASLMQSILADGHRGRRLRLAGEVSTEEADAGSLWLRIDRDPGHSLRFDNLLSRPSGGALTGTADWAHLAVVLDVPESAASIHYGVLLKGHGRVRARGLRLEAVDASVPETAPPRRYLDRPTNLGFDARARP